MGFDLAKDVTEEVLKIVNSKDWDSEQATPIPNSDGLVLVKNGSQAFLERKGAKGVIMFPVQFIDRSAGADVELLCFVCTK